MRTRRLVKWDVLLPTPNPWRNPVERYVAHRTATSSISHTTYLSFAYVLSSFAVANVAVAPARLKIDHVEDWIAGHRWSTATIRTRLGVLRPFLEWAARRKLCTGGLSADLHGPRMGRGVPRAYSADQVDVLLGVLPDARARLIVLLMAQATLRVSEVAGIDRFDVQAADGSLRIRGKGGNERTVWLSDETLAALAQWMIVRGKGPGRLISSYKTTGRGLHPTYVGMLVAGWIHDAGLVGSAHNLRHTAATNLLHDGANIGVVQRSLGHANLSTTSRYLRVWDPEVEAAMRKVRYQAPRHLRVVSDETP